jgi:hypothetical protein
MRSIGALLFCCSVVLTWRANAQQNTAAIATQPAQSAVASLGAISGTITDGDGANVQGARVLLVEDSTRKQQSLLTGSDGHYRFTDVAAGTFTVEVTADGLEGMSRPAKLQAGELLELPPIALRVATQNTDVEVRLTQQDIATEDIHIEETQRLAGFVPNFYVVYDFNAPPLSARQKFKLAGRTIVDPASFVIVGGIAGIEQAGNAFPGYGQGAAGYGKRYAAGFGDFSIGTALGGAILPSIFRQDPRYFYKGTGSNRSRALYALSTAVIARGDNRRWQPAYAAILGDFGSGAISNLYYPAGSRSGVSTTLENGFIGLAGNGLGNLIQEFFFRKITPGSRKSAAPAP